MQLVCCNTNKYAKARNLKMGKRKWKDLVVDELYCFFAILIVMGLARAPRIEQYWSNNPIYHNEFIVKSGIGRDRFKLIASGVHISNPDPNYQTEAKQEKLKKVHPLYEFLQRKCMMLYTPSESVSIDERMVGSKARVSIIQYIKDKPTKWGFKFWVLADSASGYTWNFSLYTGREETKTDKGLGYDVVMKLIRPLFEKGYKLFCDNFYTSPVLAKDLRERKTGCCGTIRQNRTGFPKGLGDAITKQSKRGDTRWHRDGKLLFVQWKDTAIVSVCSNFHAAHSPNPITAKRRLKNKHTKKFEPTQVPIPPAIHEYNKNMGGVDLSDQLFQYYDVSRKTVRWWRTIFYHMIDMAIVNSLVIYNEVRVKQGEKKVTQLVFRQKLAEELARPWKDKAGLLVNSPCSSSPQSSTNSSPTTSTFSRPDTAVHLPMELDTRKNCKLCYAKYKVEHRAQYVCCECQVSLCIVRGRNCFLDWHSPESRLFWNVSKN